MYCGSASSRLAPRALGYSARWLTTTVGISIGTRACGPKRPFLDQASVGCCRSGAFSVYLNCTQVYPICEQPVRLQRVWYNTSHGEILLLCAGCNLPTLFEVRSPLTVERRTLEASFPETLASCRPRSALVPETHSSEPESTLESGRQENALIVLCVKIWREERLSAQLGASVNRVLFPNYSKH